MSIKAVRIRQGMTQAKLADVSGVSRVQINKYERGKREPDLKCLIRLRDALGCTLDELVAEDEEEIADGA